MGRGLLGRVYDAGRTEMNFIGRKVNRGLNYIGNKAVQGVKIVGDVADTIGDGISYVGGGVKYVSGGLNKAVKVAGALTPLALAIPGLGEAYVVGLGGLGAVAGGVASASAILN